MAATTISRTSLADDSGSPASPVGDGDVWDNSELQLVYDAIDAVIAGNVNFGGLISSEAFGLTPRDGG